MQWGKIGDNSWGAIRCRDESNARGVVRIVEPGVVYKLDPGVTVSMLLWQPADRLPPDRAFAGQRQRPGSSPSWQPADRLRHEMDLNLDTEPAVQSLHDFATQLRKRHRPNQPIPTNDPDLQSLDWVVDQLLQIAAQLHKATCSVGLLDPGNVLWYSAADGPHLVLPDVGFVWEKGFAAPPWLARQQEFGDLWDREPEVMNTLAIEAADAGRRAPASQREVQNDLRTLARLFYWVLTGRVLKAVPPAREGDEASKAPVLKVLDAVHKQVAVNGRVPNQVEELRKALSMPGYRLSDYFRAPPGPEPRKRPWPVGRKAVAWTAVLLVAAVVAYLGITHYGPPPPPPPHPLCPDCPTASNLYRSGLLDELQATLKDPAKELEVLRRMYQLEPSPDADIRAREAACLEKWRDHYWQQLEDRGNEMSAQLTGDPADHFSALQTIQAILKDREAFRTLTPSQTQKEFTWYQRIKRLQAAYSPYP